METAIIPLEMQSVGENDIFKAGEQKPNAKVGNPFPTINMIIYKICNL